MSSPSCVHASVTAPAALTNTTTPQSTHLPLQPPHLSARYLIKKLHAPRRSHLIHTMEINPQINVFDGHQTTARALVAAQRFLSPV